MEFQNMPKQEPKKKNRRNQARFPALDKKYNLKFREDFLDCPYVNGVKNKDGSTAIRSMTDEEKDWLNKFNEETVVASFSKDNSQNLYQNKEDQKNFYKENNKRRICIFNYAKSTGLLDSFETDKYDMLISKRVESIDYENLIINDLDRKKRHMEYLKYKDKLKLVVPKKVRKKSKRSNDSSTDDSSQT